MPSPLCEVKDGSGAYASTTNGVAVTPGNTITIHLIDSSASTWSIQCVYTDELSSAATVTSALVIDSVAKTATFTAPVAGRAYIFESTINGGLGPDGRVTSAYKSRFKIHTLTSESLAVVAAQETTEGGAFGWVKPLNEKIRAVGFNRDAAETLTNKTIDVEDNTITSAGSAEGDILVHNGTKFVRLALGNEHDVLRATATTVAWDRPMDRLIDRMAMYALNQAPGSATILSVGCTSWSTSSITTTAATPAGTNTLTKLRRVQFVSSSSAGNSAQIWGGAGHKVFSREIGFEFRARFGISDAAEVSGVRMFMGVNEYGAASWSNIDPAAFTSTVTENIFGLGQISTSTNWHLIHNDDSGAPTTVDLGVAIETDVAYLLRIWCAAGGSTVYYSLHNYESGSTTSGSANTNLPEIDALLAPRMYRNNNATALAVRWDLGAMMWAEAP